MVWLSIVFSSLLPYRNSKRLRDFEEIEISSKAAEMTVNNKEEKTFVWISSKNSAPVLRINTTHASNTETLNVHR